MTRTATCICRSTHGSSRRGSGAGWTRSRSATRFRRSTASGTPPSPATRYWDGAGKEHARHFARKIDAQRWLDNVTAAQVRGDYVDPKTARTTVEEWCRTWLAGYGSRRPSTVRQAEVHIKLIVSAFGPMQLAMLKPSHIRSWTADLKASGRATSYVYALHARLSQILNDAVPQGIQPAVLLGAFAGLRLAEAAALRPGDVDFMRGVVAPVIQWPAQPLKSETSRTPIPIPRELALLLSAAVAHGRGDSIVTDDLGRPAGPWAIQRALRAARPGVRDLPAAFRFQDLRHYFASLLIANGLDVKVGQARLRHASAKTTLDVYGHLWPGKDDSSRAAVAAAVSTHRPSLTGAKRTP